MGESLHLAAYDPLKRATDVIVALVLLLVLAPLLALVALVIRSTLGSPVLFRQARAGRGGMIFEMVKFRTMRSPLNGEAGGPESDEERLSAIGRVLRASSLDELPELWNVLRGEMSLVGPRPLLPEYLPLYSATQARRHEVRPGITGLAQVSGRNALEWSARLALDVWYVDHRSFILDLRILILTIVRVLRRDGISQPGSATMQRFRGEGG